MSIIHVNQIRGYLESNYRAFIDLSDVKDKNLQEQEDFFLTRGLAAFSIAHLAGIDAESAAKTITDSYHDNGIDAIFFDRKEYVLHIVQSKFRKDGAKSVDRGDIQKFIQGIRDLLNAKFDRFNDKIRDKKSEIESALMNSRSKLSVTISYTGLQPLGEEPKRDLDDMLSELNDPSEQIKLNILNQRTLHSAIVKGVSCGPINIDVGLLQWGKTDTPYVSYYGQVAASEIANWWKDYYPYIFGPNIRSFLGITEVNNDLIDTLKSEPEHFWYFNNGITVLCNSIKKKLFGGDTRESGYFECSGVSIVNGAQTVGSIASLFSTNPAQLEKARVFVRFIALENCPESFSLSVTRATNTQNKIDKRDFISLDPEQERIKTELLLDEVEYVYKSGERYNSTINGFDLIDATVALACSYEDISLSVQAKREIGKLWDDSNKPPYKLLFNSGLTGEALWGKVMRQRIIDEKITDFVKTADGREKLFGIHGNRFIAHKVFSQLNQTTTTEEIKEVTDNIINIVIKQADTLYPDAYLAHLFKNLTKCKLLNESVNQAIIDEAF